MVARHVILILILGNSSQIAISKAAPCDASQIIGNIFKAPDETREWLSKHFQKKQITDFDPDLYLNSLEEFEILKIKGLMPQQPSAITDFEKSVAWIDAQTKAAENLPSISNVLKKGSERQKRRLAIWMKQYSNKELTEYKINEAAAEMAYILHNTKFNISELYAQGATELAKRSVKSQYHQKIIKQQLQLALAEDGMIKKENFLNLLSRIRTTSPGKWIEKAGLNTYSIYNAKSITHGLLFALPDHQWIKITADDLKLIFDTGGINSPNIEIIAGKLKGAVRGQVAYNSVKTISEHISRILFIDFCINKINHYKKYYEDLDKEDHS